MQRGLQGRYVNGMGGYRAYRAFSPLPLPPEPPLQFDSSVWDLIEEANRALGRLDMLATLLPDRHLFLYFYIRKEAVLSSQIEGAQSSLNDLLLHESGEGAGVPLDDVQEVSCCVAALEHGVGRLRGGFPLSLRLLREIHGVLLRSGRGRSKSPGEFRASQNWIGGTGPDSAAFVPPPHEELPEHLARFERFLHDEPTRTSVLIKAALAHVQFETIHPFQDGNGRLGRLLIPLLLVHEGALSEPLLYLSLYFKAHREEYYRLLQQTRLQGDWELWIRFFLRGVESVANQASRTAERILALFEHDRARIHGLGVRAGSALRVHSHLCRKGIISIPAGAAATGLRPQARTSESFVG
jgi:Fic family protein